ncbi:MAG: tetratricopeptide repeat protein, partial [Acidobacteriota bacterium]
DSRYVALGLSGLARVQLRRFQYEAAEELSRRALKIARQTGDPDTEATVCLVLAIALQYQSRIEEAKTVYKEIVALRQSLHDRPGEIAAWYSMALICHTMRRFPEAIDYLRQGETLSREIGDMGKLSNMLASLGAIEIHRGDYLKAHSLLEEALVLARKVGAPRTQGLALTNLGETELRLGRFAAARRHLECSSTILHWVEGGRYLVHTTLQMGRLRIATGRYHLAEESLQEAVDLALRIQDRTFLALALAGQAGVHRLQGDAATARIWCQRGRELAQEVADPQSLAACLTELGRIAHEERRCAEACELLLEARSLGREMGDQDLEHLASLALARVFLTEHRLAEAATLVEQLLERAEKAALAADLPEIMLLQGLLQLRSGDGSACVILLEQAIRQAEGACPADVGVELRQLYVVMKTGRPSMIRRVQRQLDAQLRGLALSVHGTARRRAFCRRMAKRQRHFWELAAAPPGPQMPPEQATALPVAGPETDDHSPVMENRPT